MAGGIPAGRPGLSVGRLGRLVDEAVRRCRLDLTGYVVVTEAATGPYVVTPVLAALAGAEVSAITASTRYGTVEQVSDATLELAAALGVADRICITTERTPALFANADIVTNSGHVRPITADLAAAMKPTAVVPLMFESWEVQAGRIDIDLDTLRRRGVQIAGTNERHPHVDVFSFLGSMAVVHLADAGVSAYQGRIAMLCDNPFEDYLVGGLKAAGAEVRHAADARQLLDGPAPDALLVAMRPTGEAILLPDEVGWLAEHWPNTAVVQFWGDLDRVGLAAADLTYWPVESPGPGHMGVLPSRVGPEPIVRLQAGGLKVAQVLRLPVQDRTPEDLAYLDIL